jgi:hypothetical protein
VVEHNTKHHQIDGRITFQQLDVSRDAVPAGDLVTIREVFQHLSNDKILAALENLRRNHKRAVITEANPMQPKIINADIASGYRTRDGLYSGVFLEMQPFNLAVLQNYEAQASASEILRTLVVVL